MEGTEDAAVARLYSQQESLFAANQAIIAKCDAEERDLEDEERRQLEANKHRFDEIGEEIRARQLTLDMSASNGRRTDPGALSGRRGPEAQPIETSLVLPARDRTWQGMWGSSVARDDQGWRGFDEFITVLAQRRSDPRLRAAANESVGVDGGFTVPQPLIASLLNSSLAMETIRPRARTFPMTSSSVSVPSLDWEDMSEADTIANVAIEWLGELQTATRQTPRFKSQQFFARKGVIYVQASLELVADAPLFTQNLLESFAAATARGLDYTFLWGAGAGLPQGVFASNALVTVDAESGQVADTVVYENVLNMYARLLPAAIPGAVWHVHPSLIPALLTFSVPGSGSYPAAAVSPRLQQLPDGSFSMLGLPVIVTDLMKPIGDVGDILLANWGYYGIGLRKQASIEVNNAPGWISYAQDYRLVLRMDSAPLMKSAVTPPHSAASLSPFVTLAERA